jgi:hypothetical protein
MVVFKPHFALVLLHLRLQIQKEEKKFILQAARLDEAVFIYPSNKLQASLEPVV